jgi:cytochrome c biogenesis protein CcdA
MLPVSCTGAPIVFSQGDSETRTWRLRKRLAIDDLDELKIMILVLLVFLGGVLAILSPCGNHLGMKRSKLIG